jgi:hypothetical protein
MKPLHYTWVEKNNLFQGKTEVLHIGRVPIAYVMKRTKGDQGGEAIFAFLKLDGSSKRCETEQEARELCQKWAIHYMCELESATV